MLEITTRGGTRTLLQVEADTLEEADLHGAVLLCADLAGWNLRSANLEGADLRGADLRRANLERACLASTSLDGADLRHANLRRVNARGAAYSEHTCWPEGFRPERHGCRARPEVVPAEGQD